MKPARSKKRLVATALALLIAGMQFVFPTYAVDGGGENPPSEGAQIIGIPLEENKQEEGDEPFTEVKTVKEGNYSESKNSEEETYSVSEGIAEGTRAPQEPTTEGVDVKYDVTLEDGIFKVYYDIGETVDNEDVVIDLSLVIDAINKWWQEYTGKEDAIYGMIPSDYNLIDIEVKTSNGHTYYYKDGSFRLETVDTSGMDNLTDFVGEDGQKIPFKFVAAISKSKPIQKLFGVNSSVDITIDMVANIYGYLEEEGYTGENAITDYMLAYYNTQLGENYSTFEELYNNHPESIVNMQNGLADHQYYVSQEKLNQLREQYPNTFEVLATVEEKEGGIYRVQFKWPEQDLAAASYNLFYKELLSFAFGGKEEQSDFKEQWDDWHNLELGLTDYKEGSEVWQKVNQYLVEATKNGLNKDEASKLAISMAFGLDGPWTNNAYQYYAFAWYNSITLEQVDGDITIEKVDENGEKITEPATFNLYYYKVEEGGTAYYYAVNEDGEGYFTTDSSKAAAIVTENGTATVRYLLPNYEYILKEVKAPEGYEAGSDITFTITSKENTKIEVTNKLIEVDPDSNPTSTPDPIPDSKPKPIPEPEPTPEPQPDDSETIVIIPDEPIDVPVIEEEKTEEQPKPAEEVDTPKDNSEVVSIGEVPKTGITNNVAVIAMIAILVSVLTVLKKCLSR